MKILEIVLFTLGGLWQGIRQDFNLLELVLLAIFFKWGVPKLNFAARWEPAIARFASRRALTCVSVGLLAIVLRLALLPLLHEPKPIVTDEFSHLLLADTLLSGRVANPTHPFWQHFESIHIIQRPYYVSNYFPGQALVLAAGRWLLGDPWAGIVLTSGLFCALLCWALQGWLPPRWALFGALLAVARFSIGSYWINGYYGGFLPAAAGALVLGAYARLRHRTTLSQAALLALGIGALATTRPMEGALYSLPFVLTLPLWRWRILVPATAIVGLTLAALGYYGYRVTGSPLKTAYNISQETYGWPMGFPWVKPKPIAHQNVEFARFYVYESSEHEKVDSPVHFVEYLAFRIQEYWRFFLGPALTVPLLMLPYVWRRHRLRVVFAAFGATLTAILIEGPAMPHYLAPATGVMVLLLVECFRHLRVTPVGLALARILPCIMVLVLVLRLGAQTVGLPYTQALNFQSWCCKVPGNYNKYRIADYLGSQPGRHLVFVRPKLSDGNLFQWIYNAADIDGSRIVWARDLSPEADRKLMEYFHDRRAWIVDPNVEPATIAPFH